MHGTAGRWDWEKLNSARRRGYAASCGSSDVYRGSQGSLCGYREVYRPRGDLGQNMMFV